MDHGVGDVSRKVNAQLPINMNLKKETFPWWLETGVPLVTETSAGQLVNVENRTKWGTCSHRFGFGVWGFTKADFLT